MVEARLVVIGSAIVVMYAIQGSITGLGENFLPQLLNKGGTGLQASETLVIVKLPAAMKVFFAPLVDFLRDKVPGGYSVLVSGTQMLAAASLFHLWSLMTQMSNLEGDKTAAELRWPLFNTALFNAVGDLALDAFALVQFPEELCHLPALCQVAGVFIGKTAARAGLFKLLELHWLSVPGFVLVLGWLTVGCAVSVLASFKHVDRGHDEQLGPLTLFQNIWAFTTKRPNMFHWLLYQFVMPAMYLHGVTVLPSRYEQLGFGGEDYADYDIPMAVLTLGLLLWASQKAGDTDQPLAFFLKMYIFQALLVVANQVQYASWSGAATVEFKLAYVILSKVQDLLFFVFEVGEFAFYGRVAKLDPTLVATLVTLQACAFNFADFFHSWLAPKLVDSLSQCTVTEGSFSCSVDAYPRVAGGLTLATLIYMATQWRRIHSYQDLQQDGWRASEATTSSKCLVALMLACITGFTINQLWQ